MTSIGLFLTTAPGKGVRLPIDTNPVVSLMVTFTVLCVEKAYFIVINGKRNCKITSQNAK